GERSALRAATGSGAAGLAATVSPRTGFRAGKSRTGRRARAARFGAGRDGSGDFARLAPRPATLEMAVVVSCGDLGARHRRRGDVGDGAGESAAEVVSRTGVAPVSNFKSRKY